MRPWVSCHRVRCISSGFQEVHNLANFLLGAFLSSHILKCDVRRVLAILLKQACLALAHGEDAAHAGTTATHAAHQKEIEEHQQQ